jgi:hypothetical protein
MLTSTQLENLTIAFTVDRLNNGQLPLVKHFFKETIRTNNLDNPYIRQAITLLETTKTLKKAELIQICFSVMRDKEIFGSFIKAQPKWFGTIIEKLIWQRSMNRKEIEEIVGESIFTVRNGTEITFLKELFFFNHNVTSSIDYYNRRNSTKEEVLKSMSVQLSLHPAYRDVIVDYFAKPDHYYLKAVLELEANKERLVFNAETTILLEFPTLLGYYQQGNIKYSEKGKPALTGMKKVQRTLMLKEFYDDFSTIHPIRTMLISGMVHAKTSKKATDTIPHSIKTIFVDLFKKERGNYDNSISSFIFNQIKGINYFSYEFRKEPISLFWEIMQNIPQQGWITWKNLKGHIDAQFLDFCPLFNGHLYKLYYEDPTKSRWDTKVDIDTNNKEQFLEHPLIKGCLFIFASFGLLEIAYKKIDTQKFGSTWFSEYDGLEAFKLTALGAYVLSKTQTYEAPVFKDKNKLIFDKENLIIRAEGNVDLLGNLLSNYVEKISNNRFAFRPALFLKDCKNIKQIENKIALFRNSLNIKLPSYWENQLQLMVDNATAVSEEKEYRIFKLKEADKNLLRVIAQDEILKKLVIKAENYYIIVSKKNGAAFKNRLMALDYFVEI